jgi:hypothetical protein
MLLHVESINALISLAETLKNHNIRVEIGTQINIYLNGSDDYPEIQTKDVDVAYMRLVQYGNDIKNSLTSQIKGLTNTLVVLDKALNGNS